MAGSISLSLSQQFDSLGNPLNGGLLQFFAAGTTNPQSAFQDFALTIPYPNPITLDGAGRVPPFYLADGQIKIRLTDKFGVLQVAADNLLVIGPSSGSGSPPSVDPTTLIQTGWLQPIYGTGVIVGFVRANGRTIGNASSGASERANADTSNLFTFLYQQDTNLVVAPGGRGASATADYAANKTIILPDWRGRALAALDDMGNAAAGRLTAAYFGAVTGANGTTLGAAGGAESETLPRSALPNVTLAISVNSVNSNIPVNSSLGAVYATTGSGNQPIIGTITNTLTSTGTTPSINGNVTQTLVPVASPMMLASIYIKL